MNYKNMLLALSLSMTVSAAALAAKPNHVEELDPFASDIEQQLIENEGPQNFEDIMSRLSELNIETTGDCFRDTCDVFVEVNRKTQRAIIRINGEMLVDKSGVLKDGQLKATTGTPPSKKDPKDRRTPLFDRHPEQPLRIFNKYSSSAYPGGDWKGFGNMPFVVFIKGGFGIHGTTGDLTWGNISKLGTVPLSHGCIRIHPLNAKALNEAVRKVGAAKTWIWVHD